MPLPRVISARSISQMCEHDGHDFRSVTRPGSAHTPCVTAVASHRGHIDRVGTASLDCTNITASSDDPAPTVARHCDDAVSEEDAYLPGRMP